MTDHKDKWAPPAKGWPSFDKDGKIIKDEEEEKDDD